MSFFQNKQLPFWLLTASVLIALVLPTLIQDGMFMDGLLYACVSKNLADGIGSFWFPHFSKTCHAFFDQQPPLGFWIQSVFFQILGDSMYVERFYSFLTALLTAYLIVVLWKIVFRNENQLKKLGWLPVLLWIMIPICFWAYSNNVLENTMGIFDLLSILCIVMFFQRHSFYLIILSGIFIFLASMIKGFQGMFPLVTLFIGWIVYRNISFSKMLIASLLMVCIPFLIYFLLLQNDTAYQSLTAYLNNRVLNSIKNVASVENRFYLAFRLLSEMIPLIVVSAITLLITKRKMKNNAVVEPRFIKHALFFLLIGISASFPLMVTREQRGFYLVTSFPYYAVFFAVIIAPYLLFWFEKINTQRLPFKVFRIISISLLAGAFLFSFSKIGQAGRDSDTLHDVHLIGGIIPANTTLGSTHEIWEGWSLQEYLIRHYYICLDQKILTEHDFLLLESASQLPQGVKTEKVNIPTIKYHLYKVTR